jgi:hypothetical protein
MPWRSPVAAAELGADGMLSAILLTSSLLLVLGMVSALMWLSAVRMREDETRVPVETDDVG